MDAGPALSCRLLWRIHRQLAATRNAEEVYCQRFVLNKDEADSGCAVERAADIDGPQ